MRYYFAPLEGITGHIFRRAHQKFFQGIDKYYAPFLSPAQNCVMNPKERRDILPENNQGIELVPQILANNATYFLAAAKELAVYGYQEVNLNLGCPSRTVVAKRKGAGFLGEMELLQEFLDRIFDGCPIAISIKTRIGMEEEEEFYNLLELYNRYPVKELIIHPRTQKDYYKNSVHKEIFSYATCHSPLLLCYNGDITSVEDAKALEEEHPGLLAMMIGRGLLANPGLVMAIRTGEMPEKSRYEGFHEMLYDSYRQVMSGEKNVLFKMKELWLYMLSCFQGAEVYQKKMKKVQHLTDYDILVKEIFQLPVITKGLES